MPSLTRMGGVPVLLRFSFSWSLYPPCGICCSAPNICSSKPWFRKPLPLGSGEAETGDARGRRRHSRRAGGGSSADDKPSSRRAGSAFCASLGRRVHHPVGRSGGHIRACPYSLVASQPAAPSACPPSQFLRRRCRARDFMLLVNAQTGLPLSRASRKRNFSFHLGDHGSNINHSSPSCFLIEIVWPSVGSLFPSMMQSTLIEYTGSVSVMSL